jgi:type I restriction-modification system DNA methylase subunit
MDQATHNKIVSFIWGIADDVLRDLFRRGKYPDVILPMCVIRRMDAVLERTKQNVLDTKKVLDDARITEQTAALCDAAGQAFYNTSKFTLRDLKSRGSQQQLLADFEDYLNGFSANVQDILENFKFRNQLTTLSRADAIGTLINKFLDPTIDLSPTGIDNHSMGTVFEELVRKFNEENNEEAGEHWTPRDAVRLMANLVFLPIETEIRSGTYLLYDCACGTGGMLTVAEATLTAIAAKRKQQVNALLYGQEINPETYAVCKADMLIKGEGQSAEHIVGGAEWSTLSHDAFPAQEFDFMLANPPYGKSWKKDLETMGGKDGMRDPRFNVMHKGEELSLVTRSSDGQMLFLANMASKMNGKSALGSRIAEVHNGSSLFTGDAGQGESNIRRWLIENDWLEAIVALPLNLFYNTGIATYIWVLSNKKPAHRMGRVQLIDASKWFKPLRKNLGKKNCELSPDDIGRISRTFLDFKETEESKIFENASFGYWKVTIERPLRLRSRLTLKAIGTLRFTSGDEDDVESHDHAIRLKSEIMVDHFHEQVIAAGKIGGQARAMVVTSGIERAIQYFHAFKAYLVERKSPYQAIVAFSGEHEYNGAKVSEASLNGFSSNEIARKIQDDPYRFLICADKFQTGYDEPLLHTMYVDKTLSGIKAVQTLSRLNRAHPQKRDCFVLDFQNNAASITFAFQDYFRTTLLSEETDPNKLHDLKAALDSAQVYTPEQVNGFVALFLGGAERDELDPILDACVAIYTSTLDEDGQVDFKGKAKVFSRTYSFLSSIIAYSNAEWEKISIFLNLLVPKLPAPQDEDLSKGIIEAIDMDSYRVEKAAVLKIALADQDAKIEPVPTDAGGRKAEPELDRLSNILKTFNDQFATLFTDADRIAKRIRDDIAPQVAADPAYKNAKENTPHTARVAHDQALAKVMQHLLKDDTQGYKQFVENESFRRFVSDMVYQETNAG